MQFKTKLFMIQHQSARAEIQRLVRCTFCEYVLWDRK